MKTKNITTSKKKTLVIASAVVGVLIVGGLLAMNVYKFYNPSNAGNLPTCLSNVESISTSQSCSNSRYKKASYKCFGGYVGNVGDGKTCVTKTYLKSLAETKCKTKASCQMFVSKYSETFTDKSFSTQNWTIWNNAPKAYSYGFTSDGLKITGAKPSANGYYFIQNDKTVTGDFMFEVKGVQLTAVTNSKNAYTELFAKWTAPGTASTQAQFIIRIAQNSGYRTFESSYTLDGTNYLSIKKANIPAGVKSIDLRIYKIGRTYYSQYNTGNGYEQLNTFTADIANPHKMGIALSVPAAETATGIYKSVNIYGR